MRILILPTLLVALASSFERAHAQNPRALAVQHLRAGQEAMQAEQWDVAEREFKSAIQLDPLLELAHHGLGQSFMARKRYVEALQAFVAAREAFQRAAGDQLTNAVEAERRLDDQIRLLRDQRRAIESGRVRTSGTNPATAVAKIDDQIRQLESMRRRNLTGATPLTPPYISMALGSAYFRTNAFADAEREWRAALQVDPKIGEVHNNLAVLLMLTGRFDEAESEVRLAEKSGFKVSDRFKDDLKAAKAKGKG